MIRRNESQIPVRQGDDQEAITVTQKNNILKNLSKINCINQGRFGERQTSIYN